MTQTIDQRRAALELKLDQLNAEGHRILEGAKADGERGLTEAENRRALEIVSERKQVRRSLDEVAAVEADEERITRAAAQSHPTSVSTTPRGDDAHLERGQWINTDSGERAALTRGESFRAHPVVQNVRARNDQALDSYDGLGQMLRALTTTGGSAVVPTVWLGDLIDRARNASAVMRAGATIVPMAAKTVNIGRLTGDPTATFRAEGSAIAASDPTFDNVTLSSKTLSAMVVGTMEWFQDADNADDIVTNAIAQAMAHQIDLVALYGGITAGAGSINLAPPPNPRGILAALNATLPANVLGGETNGTSQTSTSYWDEILDVIYKVRDGNEEPNALIWNTKLARKQAKAYDTTGQPLRMPADVEAMQRFVSNQVPSYTQGTMADVATDVFAGDFSQLLIGQRLELTVQVLTERYAEEGKIGIVAHWRGDVQPARSSAFSVFKAIEGAA